MVDSCGNAFTTSIGRSVYLRADYIDDVTTQLRWNDYQMAHSNILEYKLYRLESGTWIAIDSFGSGVNAYVDDVSTSTSGQPYCYRMTIEYEYQPPGFALTTLIVNSNEACTTPPSEVLVPNAFAPKGVNSRFRPVFNYSGGISNFEMVIFNRWGNKIFSTNDFVNGWNGKNPHNGDYWETGNYLYVMKYVNENNVEVELKGVVTLVH